MGVPLGSPEYVSALGDARLKEEEQLAVQLSKLSDLQAAWLLLSFCASPRANHWLRVVPPKLAQEYASGHDELMLHTMSALLHLNRLG